MRRGGGGAGGGGAPRFRGRGRARGHHQRAAARRTWFSSLANYLLEAWGVGLMAAAEVQRIAFRAVRDHEQDGQRTSPDALVELAELGNSGANPQHVRDQLVTRLRRRFMPNLVSFKLPMLSLKRHEGERLETEADCSMMAPFVFFSVLWNRYPSSFAKRFLGGGDATPANASDKLREFWSQVPESDPRKRMLAEKLMEREDIESEADIWGRAIPITLYGDAFPLSRTSFDTVSWAGYLQEIGLPTLDSKVLISGILKRCKAPETEEVF